MCEVARGAIYRRKDVCKENLLCTRLSQLQIMGELAGCGDELNVPF